MTDCRHCAGLSGLEPIQDAGVCMACVQKITWRVQAGKFGRDRSRDMGPGRLSHDWGQYLTVEFICPHGRTRVDIEPKSVLVPVADEVVLSRHEWRHGCTCVGLFARSRA